FRDRLAPFWDEWIAQVLQQALQAEMTTAARASLDSTSVAAHASRRRLLNEERLQQRRQIIDDHLCGTPQGEPEAKPPGWLATTVTGLRGQKQRYAQADAVLRERQQANAQRRSSKRKAADK